MALSWVWVDDFELGVGGQMKMKHETHCPYDGHVSGNACSTCSAIRAALAEEQKRILGTLPRACSLCLHDECKVVRKIIAAIREQQP